MTDIFIQLQQPIFSLEDIEKLLCAHLIKNK